MRLLHAGHDSGGKGAAGRSSAADRRTNRGAIWTAICAAAPVTCRLSRRFARAARRCGDRIVKRPGEFKVVNHSVPREDGVAKVTGRAIYTSDLELDGMAWAKVLRSPSRMPALFPSMFRRPGAIPACWTCLPALISPGLHPYYGHAMKDHPVLAIGKVRFIGEPVAVVVAEDESGGARGSRTDGGRVRRTSLGDGVDTALAPSAPVDSRRRYCGRRVSRIQGRPASIGQCLPVREGEVGQRGRRIRRGRARGGGRIPFPDGLCLRDGAVCRHRAITRKRA